MIGLGIVGLIYGDFAELWKPVPLTMPGRQALEYASAVLMLVCGIGLLWSRTSSLAARALFPYWVLVVLLLQIPIVARHPLVEVTWQALANIVVLMTAAWMLFVGSNRGARVPQLIFGLALIPLGLAHFIYLNLTAPLVPGWLPYHVFWAYLTGAALIAAGLGVLLGIYGWLASALVAALLTAFTILVWPPLIFAAPRTQSLWSEIALSWAASAGAWVIAASFAKTRRVSAAS
jgi:uncharacterized membrane protein